MAHYNISAAWPNLHVNLVLDRLVFVHVPTNSVKEILVQPN